MSNLEDARRKIIQLREQRRHPAARFHDTANAIEDPPPSPEAVPTPSPEAVSDGGLVSMQEADPVPSFEAGPAPPLEDPPAPIDGAEDPPNTGHLRVPKDN